MKNGKSLMAMGVFCAAVLLFSSMAGAAEYVIKIGHISPLDDEEHNVSLIFKNYVEQTSTKRIEVNVYPSAQLGDYRAMLEGVQLGTIQMTMTTVDGLAQFFPEAQATDLPYLWPNEAVIWKVQDGWFRDELRKAILQKTGTIRLINLSGTGGWRSWENRKKEILKPEDMKGLKLRTIRSDIHIELVKALGGIPTPAAWGEVYTALQTGVVEGLNAGVTNIVNMKLHEVIKYITVDNHLYLHLFLFINNKFYTSLPPDLRKIVYDGMEVAKQAGRILPLNLKVGAEETFIKSGGKITVLTAKEREPFIKAVQPVYDMFIQKYGDHWLKLCKQAISDAEGELAKTMDADLAK